MRVPAHAGADAGAADGARRRVVAVVHEDDATALKSISAASEATAPSRRQDARLRAFTSVGVSRLRRGAILAAYHLHVVADGDLAALDHEAVERQLAVEATVDARA